MEDSQSDLNRITSLLEKLRSTGIWKVSDWSEFAEILELLNVDPKSHGGSGVIAQILRARINRLPDGTAERCRMLFSVDSMVGRFDPHEASAQVTKRFHGARSKIGKRDAVKKGNRFAKEALARELLIGEKCEECDRSNAFQPNIDIAQTRKTSAFHAHIDIPRLREVAKINDWYHSSEHICLVAGDSGNGKSTIAFQFLKSLGESYPKQEIFIIDASNSLSHIRSMNAYSGSSSFDLNQATTDFMAAVNLQESIVLIDNSEDWISIESLAFRSKKCIVTAEELIAPSDIDMVLVHVDPMGPLDAVELARHFRVREEEYLIEDFCSLVGHKPRLIVDCLGMFTQEEMSLGDMNEILRTDNSMVRTAGNSSRSVSYLYERYYDRIEDSDRLTSIYLAVLACAGQTRISNKVVDEVFSKVASGMTGDRIPESYGSVCRVNLMNRFLISFNSDQTSIHKITCQLFRAVTRGYDFAIQSNFVAGYLRQRDTLITGAIENYSGKLVVTHISPECIAWIPVLARFFGSQDESQFRDRFLSLDEKYNSRISLEIKMGMTQIGSFPDFAPMLNRLTKMNAYPGSFELIDDAYEYGILTREEYISNMNSRVHSMQSEMQQRDPSANSAAGGSIAEIRELYNLKSRIPSYMLERGQIDALSRKYPSPLTHPAGFYWMDIYGWIGFERKASEVAIGMYKGLSQSWKLGRLYSLTGFLRNASFAFELEHIDMAQQWLNATWESPGSIGMYEEAIYKEGLAWASRAHVTRRSHDFSGARRKFTEAADAYCAAGKRRTGAALYVEAAVMALLSECYGRSEASEGNGSLSPRSRNLISEIDEPHLMNRIDLLDLVSQVILSGFDIENLENFSRIMTIAFRKYHDLRTYRQALILVVWISSRINRKLDERVYSDLRNIISSWKDVEYSHLLSSDSRIEDAVPQLLARIL